MKKTIKKGLKELSFLEQIKSIPKQVKMFFAILLVAVFAVAFALPSISGKMLQGNVLNLALSTVDKVDGYGYSYQPLGKCFLIEDNNEIKISCPKTSPTYPQEIIDAYNYAYEMGFTNTSIDNTPLYGTILEGETIQVLNIFANKFDLEAISQTGDSSNNDATRGYFFTKLVNMVWPGNYASIEDIQAKAIAEGLTCVENISIMNNPQIRGYAYLILKRLDERLSQQNDICQTPVNVLACSLMLADCPQQCRPVVCQTPESVLACSLGLDKCPQECRYGWANTQTGEIIKDVAIGGMYFTAQNNRMAQVVVNIKNVGTVKMPIELVNTKLYIDGNQLPEGTYGLSVENIPSSLLPGENTQFIANIFLTGGSLFTYNSFITADVSTYPEKDQNMNNNYNKVYLTGDINGGLVKDFPKEKPVGVVKAVPVLEDKQPVNVEKETKKESLDANNTLLEMMKSLTK